MTVILEKGILITQLDSNQYFMHSSREASRPELSLIAFGTPNPVLFVSYCGTPPTFAWIMFPAEPNLEASRMAFCSEFS